MFDSCVFVFFFQLMSELSRIDQRQYYELPVQADRGGSAVP